jgi:hypothetical protein
MGKIKHFLGVVDQVKTFRKNIGNKTRFTILPELSIENQIFYVL